MNDQYLRFVLALAFVLGLLILVLYLLKYFGLGKGMVLPSYKRQIKLIETLPLDHKKKAYLIQFDNKQHLIFSGPNGDIKISERIIKDNQEKSDTKTSIHQKEKQIESSS